MKITRTRGDTYADQFSVTMKQGGQPADLTGCVFTLTLSTSSAPTDQSTMVYQITGDVQDPLSGIVGFSPSALQADQVGNFYFDVQMQDSLGKVRTLVLDSYVYTQDITK